MAGPEPDERETYRRLQRHLDEMPVGFPATASGVELRILQRLFTEQEARAALLLSAIPEPIARIAARDPGSDARTLEGLLEAMAGKGLILGAGRLPRRYGKAPLAVGIYEMQVDRLTAALQEDFEQYAREAFSRAFLTGRTNQMRTIPVDARFVPERSVGRYDDARGLVQASGGPWALINCVCRQGKDAVGQRCRRSQGRRVCLVIGPFARGAVRSGGGQEIRRDEVLSLLDGAERDGLVLQPSNTRDPDFICFCCSCCCGVLGMARQMPRPADYVTTNFRAAVEDGRCAGCGSCLERCPMEALSLADGACQIAAERCIGCGLCVGSCSTGALRLETKPRPATPPRDLRALYTRLAVERFGVIGTLKRAGKALFGRIV